MKAETISLSLCEQYQLDFFGTKFHPAHIGNDEKRVRLFFHIFSFTLSVLFCRLNIVFFFINSVFVSFLLKLEKVLGLNNICMEKKF